MTIKERRLEITDKRIFELKYDKGVLFSSVFLELTQLELLKIYRALIRRGNKEIPLKIKKFIETVDNETKLKTNFDRALPYKTNGGRAKSWQNFKDVQTVGTIDMDDD